MRREERKHRIAEVIFVLCVICVLSTNTVSDERLT